MVPPEWAQWYSCSCKPIWLAKSCATWFCITGPCSEVAVDPTSSGPWNIHAVWLWLYHQLLVIHMMRLTPYSSRLLQWKCGKDMDKISRYLVTAKYNIMRTVCMIIRSNGQWEIQRFFWVWPIPRIISGYLIDRLNQWEITLHGIVHRFLDDFVSKLLKVILSCKISTQSKKRMSNMCWKHLGSLSLT